MAVKKREKPFMILEALVWYIFIVYFLYSLKNPVNIYISGLILLTLGYVGCLLCPIFRYSTGFRRLMGK